MTRLAAVPDQPPRAIVYIRVSKVGDRGDDLTSPELQEYACRDYCTRRGYQIVEILTDIDRTGRSWSKRQVENAVQSIEAATADLIVCWRFSRFSRNLRDYVIQTARIEAAGGRLEAALEEVDPATAAGLLQRDLFAILAQWESRKIGEAWRETHDRRRREGLSHRGYERLGYRRVGKGFEPDPDLAAVVVELYRRYLAGDGYRQLAEWLGGLGTRQPHSGRGWTPRAVRHVMRAGFAAGFIHRSGSGEWLPGAHVPVVDERTWRAYLRESARRAEIPPRLAVPVTALSGLVVCSGCGRSMRVKRFPNHQGSRASGGQRRRQPTYSCETFGCPRPCHVSVPRATAAVLAWLRPYVEEREAGEQVLAADGSARTLARSARGRLNRQLVALEAERTRLTRELAQGTVTAVDYRNSLAAVAVDVRAVQEALRRAEVTLERPVPSRRAVRRVLDDWDEMDEAGRNRMLRDLVWKVEVAPPLVPRGRGGEGLSRVRPFGVWERR